MATASYSRREGQPARARPQAILAVIGAGAIAAVWLWWRGTPSIRGAGGWLTGAGEILGLLAGYAVVVLIALMARIPPLERGIGADRLARWHATGGRYAIGLIVAHALLITWGYAVTAHENVAAQAATLLNSYPDMLAATAGSLLLVGVGIVSARAARRKLRYETWYYLHLCTYLAVALGFSHQLLTARSSSATSPRASPGPPCTPRSRPPSRGTGSSPRSGRRPGTGCAWPRSAGRPPGSSAS